ncbi:hypothetical protein [Buchnera aphidicola]|uniref:hypothetical protein n=1 Tax=Buchnera aphidicola TaxID=9 RepID=UPI003463C786
MINIKQNELKKILLQNQYFSYFIIGKEFFITEKIERNITSFFNKKEYLNIIKIKIFLNNDWEKVLFEYYQKNLFFLKKILVLDIQEKIFNKNIIFNIKKILKINNQAIISIFKFTKYNPENILEFFIKNFNKYNSIVIPIEKMNQTKIKEWIIKKLKKINLYITEKTLYLLLEYHKNNLLILSKFLNNLNLINHPNYPITHKKITSMIEDVSKFNMIDWIKSLLYKNKIETLKILNYFKKKKINILNLTKHIKQIIFILLKIYKKNTYKNYLKNTPEYYIEKKIVNLIKQSNYTFNKKKIYDIINILTKIEINLKTYNNEFIWINLQTLIMIF